MASTGGSKPGTRIARAATHPNQAGMVHGAPDRPLR